VQLLAPILKGAAASSGGQPPNQQLLYDAGLATWQLSFHQPAAQLMPSAGKRTQSPPVSPSSCNCFTISLAAEIQILWIAEYHLCLQLRDASTTIQAGGTGVRRRQDRSDVLFVFPGSCRIHSCCFVQASCPGWWRWCGAAPKKRWCAWGCWRRRCCCTPRASTWRPTSWSWACTSSSPCARCRCGIEPVHFEMACTKLVAVRSPQVWERPTVL